MTVSSIQNVYRKYEKNVYRKYKKNVYRKYKSAVLELWYGSNKNDKKQTEKEGK